MQAQKVDWEVLYSLLGYRFRSVLLLYQVFTHRSYLNENRHRVLSQSYERLEFIGDRVVNLIACEKLYLKFPSASEGELTTYMPLLTSNEKLSEIGDRLQLGEYLLLSNGEERRGARSDDYILACVFEALMGAVFIDCGYNYATVKGILEKHLFSRLEMDAISKDATAKFDPKSILQTIAQEKFGQTPQYNVLKKVGAEDSVEWTVGVSLAGLLIERGKGRSKREASKIAAKNALQNTENLTINVPAGISKAPDIFKDLQFGIRDSDFVKKGRR